MRSLEHWLAHLAQAHPQAIDLGLERIREVQRRLGWRQPSIPVITIAGTNGKGSVAAYCTAILAAAGYRIGTFTSPHLLDYRERIRLHDRWVTDDELDGAFSIIEAAAAAGDAPISLTFFEYNALAAFLVFESAALDAWVLEVGLGGRLDAVNVVDPSVAVVVSVGLDHQEYLGNTLGAIALEKAGIFRRGRPAVIGSPMVPDALAEHAEECGAVVKRLGNEFDFDRTAYAWHYRGARWSLRDLPPPPWGGEVQYANAATALAALEELDCRLVVAPRAIAHGLSQVRLSGRFQVIERGGPEPEWILDVAHNPAAAAVLAANLRARASAGRTFAVCGILSDKDAAGIASELRGCVDAWWLAGIAGARGASAAELAARIAIETGRAPVALAGDAAAACAAARADAGPADRIVIFGSFHTVGPALAWLQMRGLLPLGTLPEYTAAPCAQ